MSLQEYIEAAYRRAMDRVDDNDLENAMHSLVNDLSKHPETKRVLEHTHLLVGTSAIATGPEDMRTWIENVCMMASTEPLPSGGIFEVAIRAKAKEAARLSGTSGPRLCCAVCQTELAPNPAAKGKGYAGKNRFCSAQCAATWANADMNAYDRAHDLGRMPPNSGSNA